MNLQLERRHHRRFVTLNTEYHLHDDRCVGVRCRRSGAWVVDHPALGTDLAGGLRRTRHGWAPGLPDEGVSLWFDAGGMDIVTSPVIEENRPERYVVGNYLPAPAVN